jgi:hypothetical protein
VESNATFSVINILPIYIMLMGIKVAWPTGMAQLAEQWNSLYETPMQENSCLKLPQMSN